MDTVGTFFASSSSSAAAVSAAVADAVVTSLPETLAPAADAALTTASDSLVASILMIFVSEIGDKTFLIAAILAMSNPRSTIFLASCSALWLMSVLSAFLGHAVVTFVPMSWVSLAAAVMFLVFGVRLLQEAKDMDGSEIAKEMDEVEAELGEKDAARGQAMLEAGEAAYAVNVGEQERGARDDGSSTLRSLRNLCSLLLSPVFVETFVLVFLAEWGDRSQLATIALGAAKNVYGVALGTILGHTCCTAVAVLGGQLLASRISVKKVTFAGGVLFIIFALTYGYEAYAALD
ncbi:GCR1-dependent translation factor 1 [Coemansia interrupta]|uniref:GDT1 family protein n=1 Tax=Coemansia interrupta TaxID=1126814 RepID=A0A9W8LNI0_9FUNG|nr:GCR1-dependent translation factor 1 [Coemansia interrupta]